MMVAGATVLDGLRRGFARGIGDHDRALRAELSDRKAALARTEAGLERLYKLVADGRDTPSSSAAIREREDHAELQRAAIVAIEQRLGRVPVLPSSAAGR